MAILGPPVMPRTTVSSQNPILYDNGRAAQGFYTPSSKYFGWEVIPHDNKWSDGSPSFMAPISHYHLLQEESFHVESSSGYWYLRGRRIRVAAGDDITIPRFVAHWFESIPNDKAEPLVISYRYDSQRWEMEERFFRNVLTYMDDCRTAGVQPSALQLCVFLAECWIPGILSTFRAESMSDAAVNTLFTWVVAFIGVVVYGYQRSYVEYYDPDISRRRIVEESRKGK